MDQIARPWKSGLPSKSERDGGRREEEGRKAGGKNNAKESKERNPDHSWEINFNDTLSVILVQ